MDGGMFTRLRLSMMTNDLRYENVASFGAFHYQNTPKLDAGLKAK